MENHNEKVCLVCKRDEQEVPLVQLSFRNADYWICPQHIPVLIHDPGQLAGMLPDAENMQAG
jgi:hypothetical protein